MKTSNMKLGNPRGLKGEWKANANLKYKMPS